MIKISKFPHVYASGAKRANIRHADFFHGDGPTQTWDWFVGYGKDDRCQFEGSWWDMICFARNVLASENTKLVAPEFYRPDLANDNYTGPAPYEFEPEKDPDDRK